MTYNTRSQYLVLFGLFETFIIFREGNYTRDFNWLIEYRPRLYESMTT